MRAALTAPLCLSLLAAFGCGEQASTSELAPPDASATEMSETQTDTAEVEMSGEDMSNKVGELHTGKGTITIRFFPEAAPNHVSNFIKLSNDGFYGGTKFHRVIPGFMIQGGDPNTKSGHPNTWGTGGSGSNLPAEFSDIPHARGIVSMARSPHPDSASSQFFIVVKDSNFLDRQYSVFGKVIDGMQVADEIVGAPRGPNDRPDDPVAIDRIVIRDATPEEKASTAW